MACDLEGHYFDYNLIFRRLGLTAMSLFCLSHARKCWSMDGERGELGGGCFGSWDVVDQLGGLDTGSKENPTSQSASLETVIANP